MRTLTVDKERMSILVYHKLLLWKDGRVVVTPATYKIWNSWRLPKDVKKDLVEYKKKFKGSYHRAIYHYAYNLNHTPKCPECGKTLPFLNLAMWISHRNRIRKKYLPVTPTSWIN